MAQENAIAPIWRQAHRPFLLFGVLFGSFTPLFWVFLLQGTISSQPYGGGLFWHAHEMLFGFVGAIVIGFLLTAVQTWTGIRGLHGKGLIGLITIWLIARILLAVNFDIPLWIPMIFDVSTYIFAAYFLGNCLIRSGNRLNLFLVLILLLFAFTNGLTHLSVIYSNTSFYTWGMHGAVMLVATLMTVIGGRVIPMFTANGIGVKTAPKWPLLEATVLSSTWIIAFLFLSDLSDSVPSILKGNLFLICGVAHAIRIFRWKTWATLKLPIVWSIHLAYWFIPLAYILFALHYFNFNITYSSALHALTAGAMGSLILGMISRISLGHSGRPLVLHSAMTYGFLLIIAAGLIRVISGIYPSLFGLNGYLVSSIFWAMAFCFYLVYYTRILISPRADGHPG